jgi:hypothetical protein
MSYRGVLITGICLSCSDSGTKSDEKPKAAGRGGWGTWLKSFVPNKKNQAHLPDDKNPTVRFLQYNTVSKQY